MSTRKKPKGAIHNELHVDAGVLESPIVSTSKYMAYTQTPNKGEERRKTNDHITSAWILEIKEATPIKELLGKCRN